MLVQPGETSCISHARLINKKPLSSFSTSKLNSTTFLSVEKDIFNENPSIYITLHPSIPLIYITDTGCDRPHSSVADAEYIHLRDYIENCPLPCNDNQPLNPLQTINGRQSRRGYIILSTHCHYDHILGIPQFLHPNPPCSSNEAATEILSSTYGAAFTSPANLGESSLCTALSLPVPQYRITHYTSSFERYFHPAYPGRETSILAIPTPGHTPDSLAWYDRDQNWLFVGDSLYEEGPGHDAAILWPPQGSVVEWVFSMRKVLAFVRGENRRLEKALLEGKEELDGEWCVVGKQRRVRLAAGHVTSDGDAEALLRRVLRLMDAVLKHEIELVRQEMHFGEIYHTYRQDGWGMFISAPARLINQARWFFSEDGIMEIRDIRDH